METIFDQQEFVVIDHGTGFIKAGFSGEDLPRCVVPTVVGTNHIQIDPSLLVGAVGSELQQKVEYAYGNQAFVARPTHQLHFPIQRGVICQEEKTRSIEYMENMWEYILEKELNLEPKNMSVLLTDSAFNSKENKQKVAEVMFEKFRVKELAILNTAVLSLFSTGRTSGIVVESGEGLSYTVPVFEGYALPHAMHKLDIAGQDITA
mmetsp:Transcript_47449/g.34733  ORF Transcript_47449/g.34733 Transcript_47449/m.34733 type:complete len:206 (+) Transcript_47449:36-653(+)